MRIASTVVLLALTACAGGDDDDEIEDTGPAPVCTDGDTQAGTTACGLNDRGTLDEVCDGGQWTDSDTCVDPDECTDDDTDTEACWDGIGTWDITCTAGGWEPSSDCLLDEPVLASVATDGTQANDRALQLDFAHDGQVLVWQSEATTLVSGDSNGVADIFRHDLATGQTTLISGDGTANGPSQWPSTSGDGRYTAFVSGATNLIGTDANGYYDAFRHDAETGAIELVSASSDGTPSDGPTNAVSISDDGRYIAFAAAPTNLPVDVSGSFHIYLRDMDQGTTTRVSAAGGAEPVISPNGRYIAYQIGGFSGARAPIPAGPAQAYLYDSQTGGTFHFTVDGTGADADGSSYPQAVTDDGDVVFYSQATNLVANDVNGRNDLFLYHRAGATITLESVATDGTAGNDHVFEADITPDGTLIAFRSGGTSLSTEITTWSDKIYLRDVAASTTVPITDDSLDDYAFTPKLSADGRHIAFTTGATNLISGNTDGYADVVVQPTY